MEKLAFLMVVAVGLFVLGGCASIHNSACDGDLNAVKRYIHKGGDVDLHDLLGTPLHSAALCGKPEVIDYLVQNKAQIDSQNSSGGTPLMTASGSTYNLKALRSLILNGADVNIKDNSGVTALMQASRFGNIKAINCLLAAGADINARDNNGYQVTEYASGATRDYLLAHAKGKGQFKIHSSAYTMNISKIHKLARGGQDLNVKGDNGNTPAHYVLLAFEPFEPTKELLASTKGLTVPEEKQNKIAKAKEAISALVNLGADINIPNFDKATALHLAAKYNNMEMAKHLVSLGANPNVRNNGGLTPDDIFAENSYDATEIIHKQTLRKEQKLRRQRQKNDQFTAALFGLATGAAMSNAGVSSAEALQGGMAMYQDVANDTTSNSQSLINQYNQTNSLTQQRQIAENQKFLQDNNKAYENTMAQQQRQRQINTVHQQCVAKGGKWIDGQCYMPSGSQSKTYKLNTQSSSSSKTKSNSGLHNPNNNIDQLSSETAYVDSQGNVHGPGSNKKTMIGSIGDPAKAQSKNKEEAFNPESLEGHWERSDGLVIRIQDVGYFTAGGSASFIEYGSKWGGFLSDYKEQTGKNLILAPPFKMQRIKYVSDRKFSCQNSWVKGSRSDTSTWGTEWKDASIQMVSNNKIQVQGSTYYRQ